MRGEERVRGEKEARIGDGREGRGKGGRGSFEGREWDGL